jgi:hypothetical protein
LSDDSVSSESSEHSTSEESDEGDPEWMNEIGQDLCMWVSVLSGNKNYYFVLVSEPEEEWQCIFLDTYIDTSQIPNVTNLEVPIYHVCDVRTF